MLEKQKYIVRVFHKDDVEFLKRFDPDPEVVPVKDHYLVIGRFRPENLIMFEHYPFSPNWQQRLGVEDEPLGEMGNVECKMKNVKCRM